MRSWEDLSDIKQAASIYSDAHKDAYGFRPRNGGVHAPTTLADYHKAIEECAATITANEERESAYEATALARFEGEITALMTDHGIDRPTALRWWFEAEGFTPRDNLGWSRQGAEHILYCRGIAIREWPPLIDSFLPWELTA
jgi:hypothetical protein